MVTENPAGKSFTRQQLHTIVEVVFKKPRPQWAKLAGARLLHLIVPNLTAEQWMECFETGDPVEKLTSLCEWPWLLGRAARVLGEWKTLCQVDPAAAEKIKSFEKFTITDDGVEFGRGPGLEGIILAELQKVLQQPAESQMTFWPAFANGFERELLPRRQDMKAVEVYWFLATNWAPVAECKSVRNLYALVSKYVTMQPRPVNVDPVDFEDRQVKWFEKLCHRNLGVSLAGRGRPSKK